MILNTCPIDHADGDLRCWLVVQAQVSIPEFVLIAPLRSNACRIERRDHVPKGWDDPDCAEHLEGQDDH
jgi:hypothetical protein